jgi:hypothetical protein
MIPGDYVVTIVTRNYEYSIVLISHKKAGPKAR